MAILRTKRYLASTGYYPPAKKARYQSRPAMRVPRSLLPEMKQFTRLSTFSGTINSTLSQVAVDMSQGDNSNEFVGHKFRVMRLRVHYDFTDAVVTTGGIRITVYIPKDPDDATGPTSSVLTPVDTTRYTVLKDLLLPGDKSRLAGWFDVRGPFNIELSPTGGVVRKNNLSMFAKATDNQSSTSYMNNRMSYAVWYTDN